MSISVNMKTSVSRFFHHSKADFNLLNRKGLTFVVSFLWSGNTFFCGKMNQFGLNPGSWLNKCIKLKLNLIRVGSTVNHLNLYLNLKKLTSFYQKPTRQKSVQLPVKVAWWNCSLIKVVICESQKSKWLYIHNCQETNVVMRILQYSLELILVLI